MSGQVQMRTDSAGVAERRAERIRLRLDTIADNYATVLPMIREAIEARDYETLGYPSVGAYVEDRFGGALTKLGIDVRREVVRELTAAGMSSRAIAPVVGVSGQQVRRDRQVAPDVPPAPANVDTETGEISGLDEFRPQTSGAAERTPAAPAPEQSRPPIVGRDGKTYSREPRPQRRRPLPDQYRSAVYDLEKAVRRLEKLHADDRFAANRESLNTRYGSAVSRASQVVDRCSIELPSGGVFPVKRGERPVSTREFLAIGEAGGPVG